MRLDLRYRSGEEIRRGDRILYHGQPAEIEFVASETGDPGTEWFVKEFGGGVMISGSIFIATEFLADYEDLEFVARVQQSSNAITSVKQ